MIRFMVQKLLHKKWMVICLLIGNILLIAIASSNPMYKNASLQRTLTEDFNTYLEENNTYPGIINLEAVIKKDRKQEADFKKMQTLSTKICGDLGLAEDQVISLYATAKVKSTSLMQREDNSKVHTMRIASLSNMDKHINIISGEVYSESIPEDGVLEGIVSQRALVKLNLVVGEELEFPTVLDASGKAIKIRITGVFENSKSNDTYWVKSPTNYFSECFISSKAFESTFIGEGKSFNMTGSWNILFDYSKIEPKQVSGLISDTKQLMKDYGNKVTSFEKPDYLKILTDFKLSENKIITTLLILQVPVLVLLCAFIFMISRQMLDLEQNEIAMLKSRGSGKWQIITIYFLQSVFISFISFIVGLPIGNFLCRALGSTNGFLEFVQRNSLNVKVNGEVFLYSIIAILISISVMVLPVFKDANVTIVNYKQKKNKKGKSFWQKSFFDVILLGVSLYGLYSFYDRKDALMAKMLEGSSLDPFLFICSSMFIISMSLVALRVQPILVKGVFLIGKRSWKPAPFASFLQILRTRGKQSFMMVFLMLTVALGIYNATVARTILSNAEKSIQYENGADLVFEEIWEDNSRDMELDPELALLYVEPDYTKYEGLKEVKSLARVLIQDGIKVKSKTNTVSAYVMGINTKEFGETSWFEEGLLPSHYHDYLNVLSTNAEAVILSSNFQSVLEYKVGDTITYSNSDNISVTGIIYGFVDYWPSYIPKIRTVNSEGVLDVKENYMIVSHLSRMQEVWGVTPYQLWMDTDSESTQFIYDYANENNVYFSLFKDVAADKVAVRNDTLFQGTNGILTMSFIVVLILCSAGFLIYWILSIRARELLFGVFRAMGMTKHEIIQMLVNEQIFSSGLSIAFGTGIGILASKLFVPLVQIFYSSTAQALPLEVVRKDIDMVRLFSVIAFVIVVCMIALGVLISKIKISQALKLGED